MKKLIVFLLFTSVFASSVFAQNYRILYEVKAKLGKNRKTISEDFILYINNRKSVFVSYNKIIKDSLFANYYNKLKSNSQNKISLDARSPEMQKIKKYAHKIKFIIEKDFEKNLLRYQNNGFMSIIQYTQKLPSLNWKIQDSVKTILGYKAHKATMQYKGRKYIAWYTLEFAIPDGPYKFWGLPGLILEIYDIDRDYSFIIKGLEKTNTYPNNLFRKSSNLLSIIKTTEDKYLETFYKTFNKNAIIGTSAVIGEDEDEYARERIKKLKESYDNPIELE